MYMDPFQIACTTLSVTPIEALLNGGQKQVHLVEGQDHRQLVLKLIDLGRASDPAAIERARREVDLLKSIEHPNVVRVESDLHSFGSPPTSLFWLEQYLDGEDLRSMQLGWDLCRLVTLGRDIASGVGAMHDKKVVHRDLSPGNIRCLSNGRYVVMDPGFAKHTLRSGLTVAGQPGTPSFLSPEHLQSFSGAPTPASDVFGCCALVYFAATGKPPVPFKGDENEYMTRLRNASHDLLANIRPDLPEQFVEIIERGLHAQPARRFRNGRALSKAFGALN